MPADFACGAMLQGVAGSCANRHSMLKVFQLEAEEPDQASNKGSEESDLQLAERI